MEHRVEISKDLCIGCALCVKDCPMYNIRLEEGKAEVEEPTCIFCGHCVAICPKRAVSISGYEDSIVEMEQERVEPKTLLRAFQTRRSIRHFEQREIPKEILENILEAGRLTPTAKNQQAISYVLLQKHLEEMEELGMKVFGRILRLISIFYPSAKKVLGEKNFFFKKAPVAIVIFSKDKVSASLAAANMALMAESHGLGVLYSGFFTVVANLSKSIRRKLGFPSKKVVTVLVLGYPKLKYYRTVAREKAEVLWK